MNENDLRDCFAMFALIGLCAREEIGVLGSVPDMAYQVADAMLEARNKEPEAEVGIVAVKKRKTK